MKNRTFAEMILKRAFDQAIDDFYRTIDTIDTVLIAKPDECYFYKTTRYSLDDIFKLKDKVYSINISKLVRSTMSENLDYTTVGRFISEHLRFDDETKKYKNFVNEHVANDRFVDYDFYFETFLFARSYMQMTFRSTIYEIREKLWKNMESEGLINKILDDICSIFKLDTESYPSENVRATLLTLLQTVPNVADKNDIINLIVDSGAFVKFVN